VTSDADIIERSRVTPEAFAELFDRHARVVSAFVVRRVGRVEAEDIVSDTFLTAFRRRHDYDVSAASAKPWLFGIAVRLIRHHRAAEAAHWRSIVSAARDVSAHGEGGIDDADARADAEAAVKAITPALRRLSAADRETLQLYAWADLTYEEVAAALGIPVGTVRSRLNRVRRRIGAAVQELELREEGRHGTATHA
jgi:RNA polymerase sigma-70 factor (ECF subfamily)